MNNFKQGHLFFINNGRTHIEIISNNNVKIAYIHTDMKNQNNIGIGVVTPEEMDKMYNSIN